MIKSKMTPSSGSVTLILLNPIIKRARKSKFLTDYALIFHSILFTTTLKAPYTLGTFPGILHNLGMPWQNYRNRFIGRIAIFLSLHALPLMLLLTLPGLRGA